VAPIVVEGAVVGAAVRLGLDEALGASDGDSSGPIGTADTVGLVVGAAVGEVVRDSVGLADSAGL